jgi:HAD superfamily hydrolase (TIGR01509 family)
VLKGILFDLDGTLVDSLSATFESFNRGIEAVGGRRLTPQEILKHFGGGEAGIFARIVGPDKADTAFAACRAYVDEHLADVPLHAGVPELLERLHGAGVPTGIFTGRSWETTELILRHHGLLDRFRTVITSDHVSQPKPAPEGIHTALRRMGLEPHDVIYVGDTWMDLRAAQLAGAGAVAALWDLLADRRVLESFSPHHLCEKPDEVWSLWMKLTGAPPPV